MVKKDYVANSERFIIKLSGYIQLKKINQDDFFTDIFSVKEKTISFTDFQFKYPELFFSGALSLFKFGIRTKDIEKSFFGSIRRSYNYGKQSSTILIRNFAVALEKAIKGKIPDFKSLNLFYHKFFNYFESIPKGLGFKKKRVWIWNLRDKPKGIKWFKKNSNPNWFNQTLKKNGTVKFNPYREMTKTDVDFLISVLRDLRNRKFMIGFVEHYEFYDGNNLKMESTGKKSGIVFHKIDLSSKINQSISDNDKYFSDLIRSGTYRIYYSKIMLYEYWI